MKKRLLSWLLVLVMVFSLIPSTLVTTALAAAAPSEGVDISGSLNLDDSADPIASAGVYRVSGQRQHAIKVTATDSVILERQSVKLRLKNGQIIERRDPT